MNKKQIGYKSEEIVAKYLMENGWEILAKNFTIRGGEIDLIAKKGDLVSFVEVKSSSFDNMDFQDYISNKKIMALKRTAQTWIRKYGKDDYNYRFDLVLLKKGKIVDYLENFLF